MQDIAINKSHPTTTTYYREPIDMGTMVTLRKQMAALTSVSLVMIVNSYVFT